MGFCFPVWIIYFVCWLIDGEYQTGRTKSTFFPSGDPNFVYVYLKLPVGTDVKYTDSITQCAWKKE